MFVFNNNNFYGGIGGKTAADYIKGLDYSLDTVEDRIEFVKDKLGIYEIDGVQFADKFWETIFDQTTDSPFDKDGIFFIKELDRFLNYNEFELWCSKNNVDMYKYLNVKTPFDKLNSGGEWKYTHKNTSKIKLVLNKEDSLYTTSNIAKVLEILGTYILAKDKKEDRECNIRIYHSKELFARALKEESIINNIALNNGGKYLKTLNRIDGSDSNEIVDFAFFQLPKNFKKVKDQIITNEDIKKYDILKDYNNSLIYLQNKLKEYKEKQLTPNEKRQFGIIQKNIKLIKQDMIDAKNSIERPIIWKQPLPDNGEPSWDELDMFDKNHIKELLKVHKGKDLQDDLTCIFMDLNNLMKKIEFTEGQLEILKLWRQDKSQTEIGEILDVSQQNINNQLNKIYDKIIKQYEENYEDWYYLNIVKGVYKKCSKCGKIKLINRFDKNGKKGYLSVCKQCRK